MVLEFNQSQFFSYKSKGFCLQQRHENFTPCALCHLPSALFPSYFKTDTMLEEFRQGSDKLLVAKSHKETHSLNLGV